MVDYWKKQSVSLYIIDNMSTDGTWEWLQKNEIPSHQVNTNDTFDLVTLQKEQVLVIHRLKPDWVIMGAADLYYAFDLPLRATLRKAQNAGYNQITVSHLSAKNTGESQTQTSLPFNYYHMQKCSDLTMISRYHESLKMIADGLYIQNPRVVKMPGVVVNYGGCKPKEEREETLARRKKAWDNGLNENYGVHYRVDAEKDWITDKKDLTDIRGTPDFAYIAIIQEYLEREIPKIAVAIPTCSKERWKFVKNLEDRIKWQSRMPDLVMWVNFPKRGTKPDLSLRNKIAVQKAWEYQCDLVIFMEDDDYYPLTYIEEMEQAWLQAGRPILIGHNQTTYYHIGTRNIKEHSSHLKHASMFCTAVAPGINMEVCANDHLYMDLRLWGGNKGVLISLPTPPLGIKHGIGACETKAHQRNGSTKWTKKDDVTLAYLRNWVDEESFEFYKQMMLLS